MNTSTLIWASLSIVLAAYWYAPIIALLGFTIPFIAFNLLVAHSHKVEREHEGDNIALSLEAMPK